MMEIVRNIPFHPFFIEGKGRPLRELSKYRLLIKVSGSGSDCLVPTSVLEYLFLFPFFTIIFIYDSYIKNHYLKRESVIREMLDCGFYLWSTGGGGERILAKSLDFQPFSGKMYNQTISDVRITLHVG